MFKRQPFPYVKVCGITRPADAQVAASAGAHFIGLVFYEPSPRHVTDGQAAAVLTALPGSVTPVAVLVDPPMERVATVYRLGIRWIQLSGHERPDFVQALRDRWPDIRVLKALHIATRSDAEQAGDYVGFVDGFLLDARREGQYGGTGTAFDWDLAADWPYGPYFLAGGLSADRLPAAWAWWQAHPACVGFDLSSALEARPGVKDPAKVQAFFRVYDRLRLRRE
jgi:phosphoribosylanthranilate isomerase